MVANTIPEMRNPQTDDGGEQLTEAIASDPNVVKILATFDADDPLATGGTEAVELAIMKILTSGCKAEWKHIIENQRLAN
jgi:hypothetical protein